MKLSGARAVITGASRGLGLEIAKQFLLEGADVAICSRVLADVDAARTQLLAVRPDGKVLALQCDVSDPESVRHLMDAALGGLGGLDVLVNNAGVYGPKGPTDEVDLDEWRRALEINLMGVLLPTRLATAHMKARGRGKIINLSGGGATQPLPNISAYAASKAAVVRLTETIAQELREFGIDVNAVAPGALNTGMLDEVLAAGPGVVGQAFYDRALKQRDTGGTPLNLAAGLCVYLASAASDGITGRLISAQWDKWEDLHTHGAELAASDVYTLRRIVPGDRKLDW